MNTIERELGLDLALIKPSFKEALSTLELSPEAAASYDEELITRQWRKMNHKYHPNRPGGSSAHLAKCQSAYQTLLLSYRNASLPSRNNQMTAAISAKTVCNTSYKEETLIEMSRLLPPAYKIALHDGVHKLILSLKINVVDLLLGKPVHFNHIDGKTYKIQSSQGKWGGWAELPSLGLSPISNAQSPGEVISTQPGPLLVILQPLFPTKVPTKAIELIKQGIEIAHAEDAQSEIVQDWMPALTM